MIIEHHKKRIEAKPNKNVPKHQKLLQHNFPLYQNFSLEDIAIQYPLDIKLLKFQCTFFPTLVGGHGTSAV